MNLYSGICDYAATGEGRTVFKCLLFADSKEGAMKSIKHHVGEYFSIGFEFEEGISEYVKSEIPKEALEQLNKNPPFNFFWISQLHFNYS